MPDLPRLTIMGIVLKSLVLTTGADEAFSNAKGAGKYEYLSGRNLWLSLLGSLIWISPSTFEDQAWKHLSSPKHLSSYTNILLTKETISMKIRAASICMVNIPGFFYIGLGTADIF